MFNISNLSAVIVLTFIIIYTPVVTLLLRKMLLLQEQYVNAKQEALGVINDSITNIFEIKVIGNAWTEYRLKLTPTLQNWVNWDRKTRKFEAYYVDCADTIMVTIMGASQIYLLSFLYQKGQITAGEFAFILIVTLNVHEELAKFIDNALCNIAPAYASLKASFIFINAPNGCYR